MKILFVDSLNHSVQTESFLHLKHAQIIFLAQYNMGHHSQSHLGKTTLMVKGYPLTFFKKIFSYLDHARVCRLMITPSPFCCCSWMAFTCAKALCKSSLSVLKCAKATKSHLCHRF